jgi:hypothetical protein
MPSLSESGGKQPPFNVFVDPVLQVVHVSAAEQSSQLASSHLILHVAVAKGPRSVEPVAQTG